MSEKKIELEKRIHSIQSDRDGLSVALEEATDRIMMLERQTREQEIQVGYLMLFMLLINLNYRIKISVIQIIF